MSLKHVSDEGAENICPHNAQGHSLIRVLINLWNKKEKLEGNQRVLEPIKSHEVLAVVHRRRHMRQDYPCGLTHTQLA